MSDENLIRGCPLNNLAQEMSSVDPVFREKIRAVMSLWIDETEKYLIKARDCGYLKKDVDARRLAEFIVMVFGLVKSIGDRKIFNSLYDSLRDYLLSKC